MKERKKKHLSAIVLNRLFLTLMCSFLTLSITSIVFVYLYGKSHTDNFLRYQLEDLKLLVDNRVASQGRFLAQDFINLIDTSVLPENADARADVRSLKEDPAVYEALQIMGVEVKDGVLVEDPELEVHLVDQNGVIFMSTVTDAVGYDLHDDADAMVLLDALQHPEPFACEDWIPALCRKDAPVKYFGARFGNTDGAFLFGYKESAYEKGMENALNIQIRDDRIGRSGYYLLLDDAYNILCSPDDQYNGTVFSIKNDPKALAENGSITAEKVFEIKSYVGVLPDYSYYIVAVYPGAEAWENWNASIITLLVFDGAIFLILFLFLGYLIRRLVVKGVYSLNTSLARITDGNLNEQADFRNSIEFDELSSGINHTVDRLKQLIKEAETRIDEELAFSARIQASFLPDGLSPFPERKDFSLFASMAPAKMVGGDFYDFFFVDQDHLALVMADVSGKGIPAALFMVMAMNNLRHSVMQYGTDVAAAVSAVNDALLEENDAGLFVTVWLGVITLSTGHVDYVNAGHEYPAIYRAGSDFTLYKDVHGMLVGLIDGAKYKAGTFTLGSGDILYLYTDGVPEANDPGENLFGTDRMLLALNSAKEASVKDLDAAVRAAVADFVKDAPQFDDTTTLCFRYLGTPEATEKTEIESEAPDEIMEQLFTF